MNIQEYVVEKVITYMKYKDDEIKKLQDEIENFKIVLRENNINKCDYCNSYSEYNVECNSCDKQSCGDCNKIKTYETEKTITYPLCENCVDDYNKISCFKIIKN